MHHSMSSQHVVIDIVVITSSAFSHVIKLHIKNYTIVITIVTTIIFTTIIVTTIMSFVKKVQSRVALVSPARRSTSARQMHPCW